jgi:hypothetical protein
MACHLLLHLKLALKLALRHHQQCAHQLGARLSTTLLAVAVAVLAASVDRMQRCATVLTLCAPASTQQGEYMCYCSLTYEHSHLLQ